MKSQDTTAELAEAVVTVAWGGEPLRCQHPGCSVQASRSVELKDAIGSVRIWTCGNHPEDKS